MNARKPRTKSKNFSSEETSRLLDLIEELKPFGGNMWERVAFEYNRTAPSAWPERDGWKKEQAELHRQEFLEREESKKEQAEQRRRDDETRRQELKDREEREREARKREQQHELVMMSFIAKLLGNSN
ncbi:hypothetical protein DYB30_008574 [Aphanomyces astaci]|uniref:DUF6818 domain-containing protein n=1 Tax=Aphanomyces astaci TaxID=112090 RepID=A0A397CUA5_APHAT|nr:hypothetical protein DYB30_008574 [Aphanomyces astaci]